jgi:tetratricopeptide (TPR) repeat protein
VGADGIYIWDATKGFSVAPDPAYSALFPDENVDKALGYFHQANLLLETKRFLQAETAYHKAIRLQQNLLDRFPSQMAYRSDLARTHIHESQFFLRTARYLQAEAGYLRAGALVEEILKAVPSYRLGDLDLAGAHFELGNRLTSLNPRDALRNYHQALRWEEKRPERPQMFGSVALFMARCPDPEVRDPIGAVKVAQKAVQLWQQLVARPKNGWDVVRLADAYSNLATVLISTRRYQEAQKAQLLAIHTIEPVAKFLNPSVVLAWRYNDHSWLLDTCPDKAVRHPARAILFAKKAIDLVPQDGHFWNTMGVAHYRAANYKPAAEALQKSMQLRKGGDSFDFFFLAMAHWQLGDKKLARKWYGQAVRWMEKNRPQDEEMARFRAEAAALLGIKGLPVPKGKEVSRRK